MLANINVRYNVNITSKLTFILITDLCMTIPQFGLLPLATQLYELTFVLGAELNVTA